MLLRYGCSNHLSIRSFQEISLLASGSLKELTETLLETKSSGIHGLRVAAVYGANASGKTNILKALLFMAHMVEASHRSFSPRSKINNSPFALDDDSYSAASEYECDFVTDGVRYSFGFSLLAGKVLREFLYAFPKGVKQTWYSRDESLPEDERYLFGRALKGRNSLIAELTRDNSLFLSAAAQQDHEQLRPAYTFLTQKITQAIALGIDVEQSVAGMLEGERKSWALDFVSGADTGIADANISSEEMPSFMVKAVKAMIATIQEEEKSTQKEHSEIEDFETDEKFLKRKIVSLGHRSASGKPVFLPWRSESEGTKRLLAMMVVVMEALESGSVTIIDEIDASLHTMLVKRIIELFKSPILNPRGAQLVFTTHDTNILCSGLLRRDEIFFTEKNKAGETSIYPLSDFPVRKDDNFEKGYLQGRFGAIPFLGELKAIPN
jgi:AAA15 family ATPase/GTPase